MRVLHIGKFYPPAPGGIETYVGDLCAALGATGVRSHVLCHRFDASEPEFDEPAPGVSVERVPVAATFCYTLLSPSFPWRLLRAVRRFRPSLIHVHMPNLSGFACLLPGLGAPVVLHWHSDVAWPRDKRLARALHPAYGLAESMLLAKARLVLATSQAYLDGSPVLAPRRDKCRVVPLGVDPARLHAPEAGGGKAVRRRWLGREGAGEFLVVSAGRFAHYKGFEHLVRALARVPGARLVMVGDGETRPAVQTLVRELGLEDRVVLPGRLPDEDMHGLMAAADVFCLPSVERTEAFGVVLAEAMALGACCVSTAIPGSAPGWVVRDGVTGLVVPPGDEAALAEALNRLAADAGLRESMARAGRERFAEMFRMEATLQPLMDAYAEVAAR